MFDNEAREKALSRVQESRQRLELIETFLASADAKAIAILRKLTDPDQDEEDDASQAARGALESMVREAVAYLENDITVHTVHGYLKSRSFRFGGDNPIRSIGNVLRRLRDADELVEEQAGSGRAAAVYSVPGYTEETQDNSVPF